MIRAFVLVNMADPEGFTEPITVELSVDQRNASSAEALGLFLLEHLASSVWVALTEPEGKTHLVRSADVLRSWVTNAEPEPEKAEANPYQEVLSAARALAMLTPGRWKRQGASRLVEQLFNRFGEKAMS